MQGVIFGGMVRNPDLPTANITTTQTSAAINPAPLGPSRAESFQVVVPTAPTGTNPTLDVSVEESLDDGANWHTVYQFPRITALGVYNSPAINMQGTRVRYVQTLGGTTPNFRREIARIPCSANSLQGTVRQLIDRTMVPDTLNSATPALFNAQNTKDVQLTLNLGNVTTSPPSIQAQGSNDEGASWVNLGAALAGVANSSVALTIKDVPFHKVRAIVTTAGVGSTLGAGGVTIRLM